MYTTSTNSPDRVRARAVRFGMQYGIVGVLAAILIAAVLIYPGFLAPRNLENLLTQNFAVAVVAVGMTLVIISGGFDLSVGSTYALSSVTFAGTATATGDVYVAAAATIAVGLSCGAVNGFFVSYIGVNPFIATLGTMSLYSGIAYVASSSTPFVVTDPDFKVLAAGRLAGVPWSILIMIAVFVVFALLMAKTTYGRSLYAVGGNREASWLSGIRVREASGSVYVIVAVLASVGALVDSSRLGVGQANIGGMLALDAITIVIIGGTALTGGQGAIWRTAVGLVILATITNIFYNINVSQQWQLVAKGVIVQLAVSADVLIRRSCSRGAG